MGIEGTLNRKTGVIRRTPKEAEIAREKTAIIDKELENEATKHLLNDDENFVYKNIVRKILSKKITIEDFKEMVSPQTLKRDRLKEIEIRNTFTKGATERSKILETVILDTIEKLQWFGENAKTKETVDFDDYLNHTDLVAEWKELGEAETSKLAIDVTATTDDGDIYKKIKFITNALEENHGTRIKYFQSPHNQDKSSLNEIPRIIIAMDYKNIRKLCSLLKDNKKSSLESNNVQMQIIDDIIDQLNKQKEIHEIHAAHFNRSNSIIYKNINLMIKKFETLKKEKSSSIGEVVNIPQEEQVEIINIAKHF